MILGAIVPLCAHKVFGVIGFHIRVMAHDAPDHVPPLRGFLIIVAEFSKEHQQEPPIVFVNRVLRGGALFGASPGVYSSSLKKAKTRRCASNGWIALQRLVHFNGLRTGP
ncbi:hypothetical protein IW261DRAFT_1521484 [Armillaria novae-zelandiae]|uniref:Uncharacterized protein n=1 Tax=Armillaria novae-zelandiae TaxID=153914 RepID=A0AA39U3W7_9AGAR|nr:hypothetical protein IW261DRAFT_1521484 [Armillaria novae-zelandiae]